MKSNKDENTEISWTTRWVVLLVGIILILSSIIIDNNLNIAEDKIFNTIISIVSKGISAIGISLVVGFVTAKIHKSDEKRKQQIKEAQLNKMLQDVIISKRFISNLSQQSKANVLKYCLSNDNEKSRRTQYILYKANKLQEINNCTIRSNIDYVTTAFKKNNNVVLRTVMSYRIHPKNGRYSAIEHNFEKPTGKIIEMCIVPPKGNSYKVPRDKLHTQKELCHYNDTIYTNTIQIPKMFDNKEYLTIKVIVEEEGYDHWAQLVWMSLYPTETISYKIKCSNNLVIKEHMIFDNQKDLYYVTEERNYNNEIVGYDISCDKWTDPYTGFALIISEP